MTFMFYIGLAIGLLSPHTAVAQDSIPLVKGSIMRQVESLPIPTTSASSTAQYIAERAKDEGVDVQMVLTVAAKESDFNPQAIGDDGNSRGIFQISKIWHPEVSDECAYDVKCSTDFALELMKEEKGCRSWSTCNNYNESKTI